MAWPPACSPKLGDRPRPLVVPLLCTFRDLQPVCRELVSRLTGCSEVEKALEGLP